MIDTPNTAGLTERPFADQPYPPKCQWLASCVNPSSGVVFHGPLGDVPTCRYCADQYDLDLKVGP